MLVGVCSGAAAAIAIRLSSLLVLHFRTIPFCFLQAFISAAPKSPSLQPAPPLRDNRRMTTTPEQQPRNPLHGITLERIVTELVDYYGWPGLGDRIQLRCFNVDPSITSSLRFLRKTPWAREKVEGLYLFMLREQRRYGER